MHSTWVWLVYVDKQGVVLRAFGFTELNGCGGMWLSGDNAQEEPAIQILGGGRTRK